MEFELFAPEDIEQRARPFGFVAIEACCWWDRERPTTQEEQRFQIMFERA